MKRKCGAWAVSTLSAVEVAQSWATRSRLSISVANCGGTASCPRAVSHKSRETPAASLIVVNGRVLGMTGETGGGTPSTQELPMLSISTSAPLPPFAGLNDAVVAASPRASRFAFLMTMFRDVDDRPYLKQRANRLEKYAEFAAMDADPGDRR
jgi:hypothetical protein